MTTATPYLLATLAGLSGPANPACAIPKDLRAPGRTITIEDLEAVRACRPPDRTTGDVPTRVPSKRATKAGSAEPAAPDRAVDRGPEERDWRARWLSVDQRVRRLRQDAEELRAEAAAAPADPKKRPTGRRSPALLLRRADALEREARELQERFDDEARRARALPGWLRPERR